jgi:hypothetical protein
MTFPVSKCFRLWVPYVFDGSAERERFENFQRIGFFRPLFRRDLDAFQFARHCFNVIPYCPGQGVFPFQTWQGDGTASSP